MLLPVNEKETELSKEWCLNDLFMDLQMRVVRADESRCTSILPFMIG